ncbi:MAG TPA: transposase [Verrucomicrobiae bacterium]|nr:transposase [Verrucomicrobiae bacterium]
MARPVRFEVEGGWYHVTARGVERRDIFRDDGDREGFLERVGGMAERFGVEVAAYALMGNHYHLMVRTPEANLSRAIQWLGGGYGMWFNRRHRRAGHLFGGRFKAVLIAGEGHLMEVSRYVHLNPVRLAARGLGKAARRRLAAGVGGAPGPGQVREWLAVLGGYRWSSYRAYAGREAGPEWLRCGLILGRVGHGPIAGRRAWYRRYVEEGVRHGLPPSPWREAVGSVVLGGAEILGRLLARHRGDRREQPGLKGLRRRPGFEQIRRAVEKAKGQRWTDFADRRGDWGRDLTLYLGRRDGGLKLRELGDAVGGADYATVSKALQRFERRLAREKVLQRAVAATRRRLDGQ